MADNWSLKSDKNEGGTSHGASDGASNQPIETEQLLRQAHAQSAVDDVSGRGCRWLCGLRSQFGGSYLGAIMVVYLLQGAKVGFVYLATDYYFKDTERGLGLSPAAAQALVTVTGIPWNIKPLCAPSMRVTTCASRAAAC
jgi:hypothetical protein